MADEYGKKTDQNYDDFGAEDDLSQEKRGKFSPEAIKAFLLKPKNAIFIGAGLLVTIILIYKIIFGSNTKPQKTQEVKTEIVPEVAVPTRAPQQPIVQAAPAQSAPQIPLAPPPTPDLNIDLLNKMAPKKGPGQDEIDLVDLEKLKAELAKQDEEDFDFEEDPVDTEPLVQPVLQGPAKRRKIDPDNPPPPIVINPGAGPIDRKGQKNLSDFIFIDSSLNAEVSDITPNEGKVIPDLGNTIAQGRMVDAILETAINSGIPGTIRAIISRNVYAEAGRSILLPKGTRLYGTYSAGNLSSGRLVITWSRILRPDGISVGISSFASDQFGRSGVKGDVDKKFGEVITSALLISAIPLLATIAVQQATGGRNAGNTTITAGQTVVNNADPIIMATERFGQQLSDATSKIVQDVINTTVVVTIPQGTRIKVMVNQDLKLTAYKPLTALNTTVTYSSQ